MRVLFASYINNTCYVNKKGGGIPHTPLRKMYAASRYEKLSSRKKGAMV
jgi:hypothetical protein